LQKRLERGGDLPPGFQRSRGQAGEAPLGSRQAAIAGAGQPQAQSEPVANTPRTAPAQQPVAAANPQILAPKAPQTQIAPLAPQTGGSIGNRLLDARFQTAASPGSQILNSSVLNAARNGDTAGFISALAGNTQDSLDNSTRLFFQLTG
jgi:hypothetical protein